MTQRTAFGNLDGFGKGLRIAKPGYSWNDTNRNNIAFSTEFGAADVVWAKGTLTKGQSAFWTPLPYYPLVVINVLISGSEYTSSKRLTQNNSNIATAMINIIEPFLYVYTDHITFGSVPIGSDTSSFSIDYKVYLQNGA